MDRAPEPRGTTRAAGWLALLALGPLPCDAQRAFVSPAGLSIAPDGAVVLADRGAHLVFRIDAETGETAIIAGTGEEGFSGDGGPATAARLRNPEWVAFDTDGNLYVADRGNHRVRRIDGRTGVIETVAGTGEQASTGDGGPAIRAALTNPFGLVLDAEGDLFIFDTEAHRIRRVDRDTGIIDTVIGTGEQGFSGDGGPGTGAAVFRPHNGVFDDRGRLVFGDSFNQRIRRWDPATGRIETIAGTGEQGSAPAGTPAAEASFTFFGALAWTPAGDLALTSLDHRILRIGADDGRLWVLAGTGEGGYAGDGGPAVEARIATPYGLAIDAAGTVYFADMGNRRVRVVDAADGTIRTLAGGG